MDRQVFGSKNPRLQRARVDRFVVPREIVTDERRRRPPRFDYGKTCYIWEAKYQKQKKFKSYLDEALGLEPWSDSKFKGSQYEAGTQLWPCAPRRKGFLSSAESIFDLPTYSSTTSSYANFPELLDWSSRNTLVAALGINYHMYSWQTQSAQGQGRTGYPIHCCKFDPNGNHLLLGTTKCLMELHDAVKKKILALSSCKCFTIDSTWRCAITAIDWSPTGNSFVTGCSQGTIISMDSRTLQPNSYRRLASDSILSVRISPDTRFVAAAVLNSPHVHVLVWPSLEYYFSLNSNWFVKSIAWHPWRSALLGVGVMTRSAQTTIALFDTPTTKLREASLCSYDRYALDVMLFSERTGELVVSLSNSEEALSLYPNASAQLLVMSDPYTVVDMSGDGRIGLDRVRAMVFSPDGTKLGTATADEDLIIWNFFPEDKKKKHTRSRRFSAIPVYLDKVTHGFVVR